MKKLFVIVAGLLLSTSLYAGVKEKKALRDLTSTIETLTNQMKADCGNTELKSVVVEETTFPANRINIAKRNAEDFFAGISVVCKDEDYREEIAKLTQLNFSLTDDGARNGNKTKIYGKIGLTDEKNMVVNLHVQYLMSNNTTDLLPKVIKELY